MIIRIRDTWRGVAFTGEIPKSKLFGKKPDVASEARALIDKVRGPSLDHKQVVFECDREFLDALENQVGPLNGQFESVPLLVV